MHEKDLMKTQVMEQQQYRQPLLDFVRETMVGEGTISESDLQRVLLTDSAQEAAEHIARKARSADRRWGLRPKKLRRRLRRPIA